jgi:hypothetical protein
MPSLTWCRWAGLSTWPWFGRLSALLAAGSSRVGGPSAQQQLPQQVQQALTVHVLVWHVMYLQLCCSHSTLLLNSRPHCCCMLWLNAGPARACCHQAQSAAAAARPGVAAGASRGAVRAIMDLVQVRRGTQAAPPCSNT